MTLMQMFAPGDMVRALWWNTVADKQGDAPVWKTATVTRVRMEKQEVFFAHGESRNTLLLPLYDIEWEDKSSSQTQGHRPDNVMALLPDSQALPFLHVACCLRAATGGGLCRNVAE